MATTPNLDLPYPTDADDVDVPGDLQALAEKLDTVSDFTKGLFAERPAFGVTGRRYYATDTEEEFLDLGTAWVPVAPSELPPSGPAGGVLDGDYPDPDFAEAMATADDLADHADLEGTAHIVPVVTNLPSSPSDGEIAYLLVDAANGVVWQLRYRAAATTYKWEFVGGAQLVAAIDTRQDRASAAFGDLATVGPSITVPRAGIYEISCGARIESTNFYAPARLMSYSIGATAATDEDGAWLSHTNASNAPIAVGTISRPTRKTIAAANTVVRARYRSGDGTQTWYEARWLRVAPLAVI